MADSRRSDLPRFVLEALEDGKTAAGDEPERDVFAAELFATLLETALPANAVALEARAEESTRNAALRARLAKTVSEPPYRYAPFFARAAELFDLSEDAMLAEFARLADPKVWRFAGLPGIQQVTVKGGPKVAAAETLFVRFASGVRFPEHRHTGLERVLVLEGGYVDTLGIAHRAGELREWADGTEHGFRVEEDEPCIFASVVFGRRFKAWPLRVLASLLGR